MKKWILIAFILGVAGLAAAVFVGRAKLAPLVKSAVNTYGPKLTGTDIRVDSVGISFLTGEVTLGGFSLGNPAGFNAEDAIRAAAILVDLDVSSLTTDTIVIERVEVVQPDIVYEKNFRTDNFEAILDQTEKASGGGGSGSGTSGSDSEGKKLLIREVLIRDGKVTLSASQLKGSKVSVVLPEIRLENLGGEQGGVSPRDVSKILLSAVYKNATTPAVRAELGKQLKDLGIQLDSVGQDLKKEWKSMKDTFKGIFK